MEKEIGGPELERENGEHFPKAIYCSTFFSNTHVVSRSKSFDQMIYLHQNVPNAYTKAFTGMERKIYIWSPLQMNYTQAGLLWVSKPLCDYVGPDRTVT